MTRPDMLSDVCPKNDPNWLCKLVSAEMVNSADLHKRVRALLMCFVMEHRKKMIGLIDGDFSTYVQYTLNTGTPMGEAEVRMMCTMLQTTIFICRASPNDPDVYAFFPYQPVFQLTEVAKCKTCLYFSEIADVYSIILT